MAKYFEIDVTITKRFFVTAEDDENCDTMQDYIHEVMDHDNDGGDVTVNWPKELTKESDIEQSKRCADQTITHV